MITIHTKQGIYVINSEEEFVMKEHLFENKIVHRENGPAIDYGNGTGAWLIDGKMHRIGAPAAIDSFGREAWYINGELHREDGPAMTDELGTTAWYYGGNLHRLDGPAIQTSQGIDFYWVDGKEYLKEDFENLKEVRKLKIFNKG